MALYSALQVLPYRVSPLPVRCCFVLFPSAGARWEGQGRWDRRDQASFPGQHFCSHLIGWTVLHDITLPGESQGHSSFRVICYLQKGERFGVDSSQCQGEPCVIQAKQLHSSYRSSCQAGLMDARSLQRCLRHVAKALFELLFFNG